MQDAEYCNLVLEIVLLLAVPGERMPAAVAKDPSHSIVEATILHVNCLAESQQTCNVSPHACWLPFRRGMSQPTSSRQLLPRGVGFLTTCRCLLKGLTACAYVQGLAEA